MIFNFIFNLILIQCLRVLADNKEIENDKAEEENKPLKHHIVHDDMKKAIFGSFIYDPVYQMFEDHHNVMPNSKEPLDLTEQEPNPFIPLENATATTSGANTTTSRVPSAKGRHGLKWKKSPISLKNMLAARKMSRDESPNTPHISESKNQTVSQ